MAKRSIGLAVVPDAFGALLMPHDTGLHGNGAPQLLRDLTPDQADRVLAGGRHFVVHKGERLFSQGQPHDGIYLVESGRVRVFYIAPSGREITLAYWHSGNFVGGPEVYRRGRHIWSGAAMTSCRILHLPGDTLRQLVAEIPPLANGIIEGLIFKAKCYSALAQMLGTRSAIERLANLLLHLVDLYGDDDSTGRVYIAASLSHADLASMTGVTRQSVTTSLRKLAERGLIETGGPRLVVRDVEGLSAIQRGHPPART